MTRRTFLLTAMLSLAMSPPSEASPQASALRTASRIDMSSCAKPAWPPGALRTGQQGKVRLEFDLDAQGSVIDSRIAASSGFPELDIASRSALARCRFVPATEEGKPVASSAKLEYIWTQESGPPPGRQPGTNYAAITPADLRKAADAGDRFAQHFLGLMLLKGELLPYDLEEAKLQFQKSLSIAQSGQMLGSLIASHATTAAQEAQGLEMMRTYGANMAPASCTVVGQMLETGKGIPQSYHQAAELYIAGAYAGTKDCQLALASLYERGKGVPVDPAKARRWREAAARPAP
jgi:TonB family protein